MTKTPLLLVMALGIGYRPGISTTSTTNQAGLARFEHQPIAWKACQTSPDDQVGAQLDAAGTKCTAVAADVIFG
jgi:hypothetical protein